MCTSNEICNNNQKLGGKGIEILGPHRSKDIWKGLKINLTVIYYY